MSTWGNKIRRFIKIITFLTRKMLEIDEEIIVLSGDFQGCKWSNEFQLKSIIKKMCMI
jgi:hypothetical protein